MSLRSKLKSLFGRRKQKEPFQCVVELKHAEELTLKGKLGDALEEVEKIEKTSELSEEDLLTCRIIKSDIMNEMGKHGDALELADEALKKSRVLNNPLLVVEASIRMANALHRLGRHADGLRTIDEAEQALSKVTDLPKPEFTEKTKILKNRRGTLYIEKGETDLAIRYFKESLELSEELGDKRGVASILNNIGYSYQLKGELDLALENYQNSLKILEEIDYKLAVSAALNNIGLTYHLKGELGLALESLKKSLAVAETIGYKPLIAINLGSIGIVEWERGEIDFALEYYEKSLYIHEELGNNLYTSDILFRLVALAVEDRAIEASKVYMQKLETLRGKEDNKIINQRCLLSEALMLKSSDRLVEKAKAQEIFKKVAEEPVVSLDLTTFASLNLCELLLIELKTFGNEKVLTELKAISKKLLDIAKFQNSFSLLVEAYLLQSKLVLLELDVKQAQRLLSQAQEIAEAKGLRRLAMKISSEHDSLLDELSKWDDLVERNASMAERLELVRLEDMVVRMIRKRAEEIPEVPEESVMLLIMNEESGLTLFSKKFLPEGQLDEQIIGGFLSAINSFSREMFDTVGSLERIKHENFTIMMKPMKPLMFCYVFKGQSYQATHKLDRFINALRNSADAWNALNSKIPHASESDLATIQKSLEMVFL